MLHEDFVILGAVIALGGSLSYAISTLRGKTKPNRVTWCLWALAPFVAFAAEIGQGVGLRALTTFMVGFGPLLVFIASFVKRTSYWKISALDWTCGALSLVALCLWGITRIGNLAIVLSIASDALAALPTVIKAYREPASENARAFLFSASSALITLLTITSWNFAVYAFPLYICIVSFLLFILISFPGIRIPSVKGA
jgi:hypothetical protein